jgi:hypothetical protein
VGAVKNIKSHLKVRSFFNAFFGWLFYGGKIAKREKVSNKMETFGF